MSRVRTLSGLHLITLDPDCIPDNNPCFGEINRLRSKYRPDLPEDEKIKKELGKRKLTDCFDTDNEHPTKKIKLSVNDNKCDVSINKSLLPIVIVVLLLKLLVHVLKNQKWTIHKSLINHITHHKIW